MEVQVWLVGPVFRALQPQVIHQECPTEMVNSVVLTFRCGVEISKRECGSVMELKRGVDPPVTSLPLAYVSHQAALCHTLL